MREKRDHSTDFGSAVFVHGSQTLHGTAIFAYIGLVLGGRWRHIYIYIWHTVHGVSGVGLSVNNPTMDQWQASATAEASNHMRAAAWCSWSFPGSGEQFISGRLQPKTDLHTSVSLPDFWMVSTGWFQPRVTL